jgi:sensor c-di-GMP phosphodiesterase-like protein
MAQTLGMATIAEGVETDFQASYLMEKGVSFLQGYFYSPALPAAEFMSFWESFNTQPKGEGCR